MYFKKLVQSNPRLLKVKLQGLIVPLDRGAIVCVHFIGRSVVEILVDVAYKQDVIEALRLCHYRYMSKATPFWNFAAKHKDASPANDMLFINSKLVTQTTNLLLKIDHPAAPKFFNEVRVLARENVEKARADGADISEHELHPARPARDKIPGAISTPPSPTNGGAAAGSRAALDHPKSPPTLPPSTLAGSATPSPSKTPPDLDRMSDVPDNATLVPEMLPPIDDSMGSPPRREEEETQAAH